MKSLYLLLLLASVGNAQQVTGIVRDRISKEPIPGASIQFRFGSPEKRLVQSTRLSGEFRFDEGEAPVSIFVHSLGYRDTLIAVGNPGRIEILLERTKQLREEVVVTTQRKVTALQDVPISTATIREDELQSRSPTGLDQVLRFIPGVSITESQVNIRGYSGYARSIGSRVLLLFDGMPFLSADNGDMKLDALPLYSVERVEVVKGAGSALYGSSALGGVVNVLSRAPSDALRGAISIYGGLYEPPSYQEWLVPELTRRSWNIDAGISNTIGEFGYLASGGYKRNEGYRIGDDFIRTNFFGKGSYRFSEMTSAVLTVLHANEDHGGWLYWRSLGEALRPKDSVGALNERINSSKLNVAAHVNSMLSDDIILSVKTNLFRTDFTTAAKSADAPPGPQSIGTSINTDITVSASASHSVFLTTGITPSIQSVRSNIFGTYQGTLFGAYTQLEWNPMEEATITLGVRGDYTRYAKEHGKFQVSPKAGVRYELTPDINVRASYGAGFRTPTIGEKYVSGYASGFPIIPNLQLAPERSNSGEFGINWNGGRISMDGAVFYSSFDSLIEPTFVGEAIQFQNVPSAFLFGHEESLDVSLLEDESLRLRLNYTYVFSQDRTTKQILKFRPRHLIQSRVSWTTGDLELGSDFRYISRYENLDSSLQKVMSNWDARVATYLVDVQAKFHAEPLIDFPLSLSLQIANILNYYYVEVAGNLAPPRQYILKTEVKL